MIPQALAGWRTEPPLSDPSASGNSPAASPAPEPEGDPLSRCTASSSAGAGGVPSSQATSVAVQLLLRRTLLKAPPLPPLNQGNGIASLGEPQPCRSCSTGTPTQSAQATTPKPVVDLLKLHPLKTWQLLCPPHRRPLRSSPKTGQIINYYETRPDDVLPTAHRRACPSRQSSVLIASAACSAGWRGKPIRLPGRGTLSEGSSPHGTACTTN